MFQKRHYVAIADQLAFARPDRDDHRFSQGEHDARNAYWESIVARLALCFEHDNANFNRRRFIDACHRELGSNGHA